jgi:hypothetical protein
MAVYGSNNPCVMFFKEELPEPLPETKSQAMPAHRPNVAWFMPGGKTPKPAPGTMKNLPWRSWLGPKRPHSKRAKRRSSLSKLMGGR